MTALLVGAFSDVGLMRRRNEDHFLVDGVVDNAHPLQVTLLPSQQQAGFCGLLCAVADGLGGHAGGDQASRIALDTLARNYPFAAAAVEMDEIGAQLRRVVHDVDRAIRSAVAARPELSGMGSTIVGMVLREHDACGFNIGDSRLYRLRDGFLKQVSADHTVAAELERAGHLTHEQAESTDQRHVITNCVGGPPDPNMFVDLHPDIVLRLGDRFLLCSDGVSGAMDLEELEKICGATGHPAVIARALVDEANRRGGADNATAVVIEVAA